jgi:hypothetical protein
MSDLGRTAVRLLRTRPAALAPRPNSCLPVPMKRLTPIEYARVKGRSITMSMPDREPEARARILAWLEQRPGDNWRHAKGDNYAFETAADAAAFKQWLMSALIA